MARHPELVDRYRRTGARRPETLANLWQRVADAHPEREAVVAPDGRMTYAELAVASDRIAVGLRESGLLPGERVLVQSGNSVATAMAWYGMLKAGLVPVCTLPAHRHHEIEAVGRRAGAAAHLVQEQPRFDVHGFAAEMSAAVPSLRVTLTLGAGAGAAGIRIEDLAAAGDPHTARAGVTEVQAGLDPDGIAVLQLSGGTTGTPKLIPRRHHEYWYNAERYAAVLGWDAHVRVAHLMPIVHNAGIVCGLHAPHSVGGTAVLLPPDPDVVLPAVAAERVTDLIAGTPMAALARSLVGQGRHLERIVIAGSKPPEGMFELFESAGVWVGQLYGMAEGFFTVTPLDAPRAVRRWSVGVPISESDEAAILGPGTETEVPDGEVGEMCVRGPYTVTGYFDARPGDEAAETTAHNARAFTSEGYYRTGDLGMVRIEDGHRCYSIEGRIKDVIDRGGEKISVDELEALLAGHPRIAEVAVVAMPDPRLGERGCAFVVPRAGEILALPDVQEYLAGRGVAKFKWPERVELVDALPRTAVGKIDKNAMRAAVAGLVEAQAAGR
ncbi:AMP-binding protein [Pseudonocardia broussonetiae]|uniref:AMP-binding protein n=1 Tax=Pseudonocardia broussonetiae TaxID=2736640 RepID=A0A6M6JDR4_9PSEU|nr:AMP-binding protein [Pseudonocardia broussonetiae]QJY46084.1 AMP-binding protein [Pseudonocardia broussonetiae]